jgi:DNA helicase-2/ATP-dependent DNA helicase PcrA
MYRRDKGYRIGMAKSVRSVKKGIESTGLQVRCNQENADKMWVLRICKEKSDARYWEALLSVKYGIPSMIFKTSGRGVIVSQEQIDRLFSEVDTKENIKKLFADTGLLFNHPHYLPQGTTNTNTIRSRVNLNLKMFDDKRRSVANPWGISRVSINTSDIELKEKLVESGFKPRKGKRGDWRLEITKLDYGEAEEIVKKITKIDSNITVIRSVIAKEKRMYFHPASNIIPGMLVAVFKNGSIIEEKVIEITKTQYEGEVYDLNIDKVHNYIADSIAVHNCIYSWRGADIKNLLDFEKSYPETKIITLEENYRSTQTILAVANNVIKKNVMRPDKNLFTKNIEGEKVELLISYTEQEEARMVAEEARKLIQNGNNPREIAVLYRANFQSRVLEEAFLNKNIPYQVLGVKFFERKEVKDVLSFIKASMNRDSTNDLVRVVNVPPRGIGKATIMKVITGQASTLGPSLRAKVDQFTNLLERIKGVALKDTPSNLIKFIITESGIENVYKNGSMEEQEKLENLRELVSVASQYDSLPPGEAIEKLLENAALATDQDEMEKDNNAVKLMTVHASKGLEFDYVFIAGMEEDLFPHQRMNEEKISQSQAEEERRLFYVALTRARKKIFLSYTQLRTIFGAQKVNTPSSFISDIGDEHITSVGDTEAPRGIKAIFIDF